MSEQQPKTHLKQERFDPNCKICQGDHSFMMEYAPWFQNETGAFLPRNDVALQKMIEETPIFFELAYERFN